MSARAQKPTTGYAPVSGLNMYYEVHGNGSGDPVVLLHGSFMTITNNWTAASPNVGGMERTGSRTFQTPFQGDAKVSTPESLAARYLHGIIAIA